MKWYVGMAAAAAGTLFAGSAFAGDATQTRPARADEMAGTSSAREVRAAVDAYLAGCAGPAAPCGVAGSAGYDRGFWIRGGDFLLRTNLTIQARWEGFDWDDSGDEPSPGGDLSGFSLPRLTLRLSGDALCRVHYYAELEFGHPGSRLDNSTNLVADDEVVRPPDPPDGSPLVEGWIEYEACPALAVRMGLVTTATPRQLMTAPELQQFVDVSLASAYVGEFMPGFRARNRDYGVMVHGTAGCAGALSWLATITNGDAAVRRNVLEGDTDDNLAYSARLNYDLAGHMGYEEGAVRQNSCEWVASVGAWAHYYSQHRDKPHVTVATRTSYGVDAAVGTGGFSFTGAYTVFTVEDSEVGVSDIDGSTWLAQVGYLFPNTAWEVAARYDAYSHEVSGGGDFGASEYAFAVNYYVDGHADKVTADVSFIQAEDDGNFLSSALPGYNATLGGDGVLLRFQWQLVL